EPGEDWKEWATTTAAVYGLTLEDAVAYHQAIVATPAPGIAQVVFRGSLGGIQGARLVLHAEPGGSRLAVVVPVGPDTRSASPDGDQFATDPPVRIEVREGLAGIYPLKSSWGTTLAGDVESLLGAAAQVLSR